MFFKRIIRGSTFKRKGIYAIMTPVQGVVCPKTDEKRRAYERNHTCRRKRDTPVPVDEGDIEAAASDL